MNAERTPRQQPYLRQAQQCASHIYAAKIFVEATMLISESHQDVPTSADGDGTMRRSPFQLHLEIAMSPKCAQVYSFSIPPYPITLTPNSLASSSSARSIKARLQL